MSEQKQKKNPELRFEEFQKLWDVKALQDSAQIIDCKHRTPLYIEDGIPVVSPGLINWGVLKFCDTSKFVTFEDYESLMDHCTVEIGDIVMSRNQSVGIASIVDSNQPFVLGQDTVLIKSRYKNTHFIYFNLQTEKAQALIKRQSGGSTFSRINLKDIRKMKLSFPSLQEQSRIASFLTTVDRRITLLQKKKEALEQYKKGIMQKIFSQDIRFKDDQGNDFPDWEEKVLGDISTIRKGKGISKNDICENGEYKCIRYGELYTRYQEIIKCIISRTDIDVSDLVFSEMNDVIIPSSGETSFDIATASCVMESGVALGGDINIIRSNENGIFLSYYLNNAKKMDIARFAQGISVIHLYGIHLKELHLSLPSLPEQQKIADFLSSINKSIDKVSAQIETSQTWKKGLLQRMFV